VGAVEEYERQTNRKNYVVHAPGGEIRGASTKVCFAKKSDCFPVGGDARREEPGSTGGDPVSSGVAAMWLLRWETTRRDFGNDSEPRRRSRLSA